MAESPYTRFKLNHFIIDCQKMTIDNGEKSVKLPVKVFDYLKLFLVNENHVVEHDEAIKSIWNGNEGVGKRGYINAMWQIRKAFTDLGGDCDELFKTLPKVGYVLTIKPEPIPVFAPPEKSLNWLHILLFLLLGLSFFSISIYLYQVETTKPDKAISSHAEKYHAVTSVTNFQGVEVHPSVSHDGNMLAFQWIQENKRGGLYIKDLRDSNSPLRLVSSGKYQETLPTWSPDDTALAYLQLGDKNQCQVHVMQLLMNQEQLIDTDCWYIEYKKMLDWSPDGKMLLYSKRVNGIVSFFKYDFETKKTTQVSFPEPNTNDLMAIWSADSQNIILLREKGQQYRLFLLTPSGQEMPLLDYKESITGLTRGKQNEQIFVNYSENGKIATYLIDFSDSQRIETRKINQISGASGLSFNSKTNELFIAKHQSNEYIVQREFDSERIIRRIFSSHRNLYGSYISNPDAILFLSNRSENWDLWRQNEHGAQNLTNGIGIIKYASASPDGLHFVTTTAKKEDEHWHLYLGDVLKGTLSKITTGKLIPEYPTWSSDGSMLYFAAINNNRYGIYQYNLQTSEQTQLTSSDETYAIPAGDDLFVSRTNEKGIWRFNINSRQFTKVVDDLAIEDFGSFFTQDGGLYYLSRTPQSDNVMKYIEGQDDQLVASYPADSIRKYFGITKGDKSSFLLTLNSIYDADIYSFSAAY